MLDLLSTDKDTTTHLHRYHDHCCHCPCEDAPYLWIHLFMEDEEYSLVSYCITHFVTLLVAVSTFTYIFQTIPSWEDWRGWMILETTVSLLFSIEYGLRIFCSRSAVKYLQDPWNMIDFCAVVPFWVELMTFGYLNTEMLRIVRSIRLIRLVRIRRSKRWTDTETVLTMTFRNAAKWLIMFFILVLLTIIVCGSFEWNIEIGALKTIGECDSMSNRTWCWSPGIFATIADQKSRAACRKSCSELVIAGCCLFDQMTGSCRFRNASSSFTPRPAKESTK